MSKKDTKDKRQKIIVIHSRATGFNITISRTSPPNYPYEIRDDKGNIIRKGGGK